MENQPQVFASEPPPIAPEPQIPASMQAEPMEESSWLSTAWGIVFFIILIGTGIGIFLWWVWGKSPLRLWVKILISVIPIALLAIIL